MLSIPRRRFISICAATAAGLMAGTRPAMATRCHHSHRHEPPGPHPEPRPGITGEKVATAEQLGAFADALPAFDAVRAIPEIVDGIRCNCGCAGSGDLYSLLSCFEGPEAMARYCQICQGQGRLAYRLHQAGKTLDDIRAAIDARFG
jgi:hypothetical protein